MLSQFVVKYYFYSDTRPPLGENQQGFPLRGQAKPVDREINLNPLFIRLRLTFYPKGTTGEVFEMDAPTKTVKKRPFRVLFMV